MCACTVKHVRLARQESFLTIGDAEKQRNPAAKGILYGSHKKHRLQNQGDLTAIHGKTNAKGAKTL